MVDLSVEFAGIDFKNPIIAASATPTKDARAMKKAVNAGFGGVVAKSLFGNSAAAGRRYPRPRFRLFGWREFPCYPKDKTRYFTLHSLEDCSTFDYEMYAKDVNEAKRLIGDDGVVIASISGTGFDEWEDLCAVVNGTEADMCEINISCPFAADMGFKIGAGAINLAPEIIRAVKRSLSIPLSVKLTPQVPDLASIAKAAEASGADALTVQARLSGIMIDIETARPIGWGSIGGYGGPYLIGYGLKGVSEVASKVKIPISGVLGVWSWEDIIQYIMVGATTVQSATAVIMQGYRVAKRWLKEITDWMLKKGYESIYDFRGSALKNIISTSEVVRAPKGIHVNLDSDKCIGCGECLISCFYEAIELSDGKASIDQEKCDLCGLCLEKCPTNAINFMQKA
ncbi:MAG: 4Fe-4S binding protein [Candidatus Bathyarchaeia archaeon]